MISIQGLNKAAVLAALYNAAQPQGMGFMQYQPDPINEQEAGQLLAQTTYFDYVQGRVMKVDLAKDEFNPTYYDRDNGQGTAERVINSLRATGNVNSPEIAEIHRQNTATQIARLS